MLDSADRYRSDIETSLASEGTAHFKLAAWIPAGASVLDVGCADGALGSAIRAKGSRVIGVERDPQLADTARARLDGVIQADLESPNAFAELGDATFDVILCADVLEHLNKPWELLSRLRALLAPQGSLLASIPNVAHVSVALELLRGNFDYRPLGLLDETHVRFFSHRSIFQLFERAGFRIDAVDRTRTSPADMEIACDLSRFGPELIRYVEENRESVTYQFVLRAKPLSDWLAWEESQRELRELRSERSLWVPAVLSERARAANERAEQAARTAAETQTKARALEEELAASRRRETNLSQALEIERAQTKSLARAVGDLSAGLDLARRELQELKRIALSGPGSKAAFELALPQPFGGWLRRRCFPFVSPAEGAELAPDGGGFVLSSRSLLKLEGPLPKGSALVFALVQASAPTELEMVLDREGETKRVALGVAGPAPTWLRCSVEVSADQTALWLESRSDATEITLRVHEFSLTAITALERRGRSLMTRAKSVKGALGGAISK